MHVLIKEEMHDKAGTNRLNCDIYHKEPLLATFSIENSQINMVHID